MGTPENTADGGHGPVPAGRASRHAQRDQDAVWNDVLELARYVETALRTAITVLCQGRSELLADVKAEEAEVDRREVRIEQACLRVLALYEPVAFDLRRVIAALRINRDLERLSDIAESLAKRARKLLRDPVTLDQLSRIEALGGEVLAMLEGALDALTTLDVERARAVMAAGRALKTHRDELTEALKEGLRTRPDRVNTWLRLMSSARNLSRAGSHVRQIAATVVYVKEGLPVQDEPQSEEE